MTRLHIALLASLILHALGLLAAGTRQPLLSGQMRSSLSVQLVGGARDDADARATRDEATLHEVGNHIGRRVVQPATVDRYVAHATASVHNVIPPTLAEDDGAAPPTSASDAASTTGDAPTDTVNSIKARLHTDLARHFDYPDMARRRGWEGRVMLAFDVESDGQLQQIHVARSSGFAVLDDSALNSLRRVERIVEAAALLQGRRLAMQIPVVYRLEGDR